MSLQLTNNEWLLKLETEVDNSLDKYLLGSFSNPFVILNFTSATANPVWSQAGYISQAILIDNSLAFSPNQAVLLNINNFRKFDALSGSDYQLYYFPPKRLETVEIKVWEYQGIVADSLIADLVDYLSQVPANQLINLTAIEEKLAQLLTVPQVDSNSDFSTTTNFLATRFT